MARGADLELAAAQPAAALDVNHGASPIAVEVVLAAGHALAADQVELAADLGEPAHRRPRAGEAQQREAWKRTGAK